MKSFVVFCVALVAFETVSAQVIQSVAPGIIGGIGNCGCPSSFIAPAMPSCPSPVIAPALPYPAYQPSVAARLADTLSLLTVSSLLSEALPLGPIVPSCGCSPNVGYYY